MAKQSKSKSAFLMASGVAGVIGLSMLAYGADRNMWIALVVSFILVYGLTMSSDD